MIKIWRLKLHYLVELSLPHLLLHELVDVEIDLPLRFIIGFVNSVPGPTPLLLLLVLLVVLVAVETLHADTVLSALHSLLEAEAVFLLAVRFFTGAKNQILHTGIVWINLLIVVEILQVLLLDVCQDSFLRFRLLRGLLPRLSPSARCCQEVVFWFDAFRTTLTNNTDFARS